MRLLVFAVLALTSFGAVGAGGTVVFYGGPERAVEAAVRMKARGADVLVVTPRMYLGEDAAATLALGGATPLDVKRRCDEKARAAGVGRMFGTVVRDVLRAPDGRLLAVEVANRSGRRFLPCSVLVDATRHFAAARRAGVRFSAFKPGSYVFSRRVISGEAPQGDGLSVRLLPGEYPVSIRYMKGFWGDVLNGVQDDDLKFGPFTAKTYLCSAKFDLSELSPAALASVEDRLRTMTFTRRTIDQSEVAEADFGLSPVETKNDVFLLDAGFDADKALAAARGNPRSARDCKGLVSRPLPCIASCDVFVAGGGTAGAPAAIASAREGARTILAEAFDSLGGTMTEGRIGNYWYGNLCGFTVETDYGVRKTGSCYSEAKSEWFRRELTKAGGEAWFNSPVVGVVMEDGRVTGVETMAPDGSCGVVRCKVAVDATGNSLLAEWAGAETQFLEPDELSVQASGWAPHDLGISYNNTHLTLMDVTSAAEIGRFAELSRRSLGTNHWNQSQIEGSRERRRIVGEIVVSPLDILCHRTYPDTITRCYSDFDTHGQSSHPVFRALGLRQNAKGEWADLPYRALVPRKVRGLLVVGLGVSAHRDAMPILRMQPDVQNHGFAAGLAAATCAKAACDVREIDVRALQRKLVKIGILKQEVLTQEDSFPLPEGRLREAVRTVQTNWTALATLMVDPKRASELLAAELAVSSGAARLPLATSLGLLGDKRGVPVLIAALETADFSVGWKFNEVRGDGYKGGPADRILWAIGACKGAEAVPALVAAADKIVRHPFYSHFRAYARAAEMIGDRRLLDPLEKLLNAPGVRGHAQREMTSLPYESKGSRKADAEMGCALRELALARAIWTIGRGDVSVPSVCEAKKVLDEYAADARGVFRAFSAGAGGI